MPSAVSWRAWWFRFVALAAAVIGAWHLAVAAGLVPGDGSPRWRHALFAGINAAMVPLVLTRPRWLFWAGALLTLQPFGSHGARILRWWEADRAVDWPSIVLLAGLLVTLGALWRERRAPPSTSP